ncbi:hypothetical protein AEA09_15040 [Lysinibacillus contaminans]|uniref:Uncharacterized protein n=1 Tax=Lysinibacillus contaminans TaxID=1293441 RepID=A0ABR5JXX9_9BACI|nr:hypothetical protein [Lysinibacillus contaminans]KOS67162.1 hypothetical protein AEA09_15040 [Lysinibacillus contaminans]
MTKKVILVVVEGETEQIILYDYLDMYFAESEVRFDVQRGDILTKWEGTKKTTNIKNTVGQVISRYLEKNKFLPKDLLAIVQITDADGCFIPHEHVKVSADVKGSIFYDETEILVGSTKKKEAIEARNTLKAQNIKILATSESFTLKKNHVPYQLFYFSTNLEHVLWGERNEEAVGKVSKADEFIETLSCSIEEYLRPFLHVNEGNTYDEKLEESWAYVMQDCNSLQRSTNVPLLVEMVEQIQRDVQ